MDDNKDISQRLENIAQKVFSKENQEKVKSIVKDAFEKLKTAEGRNAYLLRMKKFSSKVKSIVKDAFEKLKTAEGRNAYLLRMKKFSSVVYNKILDTWRSGRKGKVLVVSGVIALILILKCCFSGGWLVGSGVKFTEDDFETVDGSDNLFYDDGMTNIISGGVCFKYMSVAPNYKKLPDCIIKYVKITADGNAKLVYKSKDAICGYGEIISSIDLTDFIGPSFTENGPRKKDTVCVHSYEKRGECEVKYVGDGYVIVKPYYAHGKRIFSCIYTDHEYIDGQRLNDGLYEFIGYDSVLFVNGAKQKMLAFRALDDESNNLYFDAIEWNKKAFEAAEEENEKRLNEAYDAAKEKVENEKNEELKKRLPTIACDLDFKKRLFLPSKLNLKNNELPTLVGESLDIPNRVTLFPWEKYKELFDKRDVSELRNIVGRDYDVNDVCYSLLHTAMLVNVNRIPIIGITYVSVYTTKKYYPLGNYSACKMLGDRMYHNDGMLRLEMGEELYCVLNEDNDLLELVGEERREVVGDDLIVEYKDPDKFVKAWYKRYGKKLEF